ncbi:MAG: hypothetical protein HC876_10600 [Chloroflexaceae bacterium]|nr:hypothetical protein [Chloroflexaceae bacterium]
MGNCVTCSSTARLSTGAKAVLALRSLIEAHVPLPATSVTPVVFAELVTNCTPPVARTRN